MVLLGAFSNGREKGMEFLPYFWGGEKRGLTPILSRGKKKVPINNHSGRKGGGKEGGGVYVGG